MSFAASTDSLYQRTPGAVAASVDDEIVLMKVDSGECIGLGATGSAIWRLLEQPVAFAELITRLRETYDAPAGVVEQDASDFLADMQRHGLIQATPAQS